MQAVLLAAGNSSRFYPFNTGGHKSLFRLQGKTILEHTLESLKKSDISDVIIIIAKNSTIPDILKKNSYGFSLKFIEQSQPMGMGDALLQATDELEESFFILHPHHVEFHELYKTMLQKKKTADDVVLLGKKAENIDKFGSVKLEGDRVVELIEKPHPGEELSNIKVVGIYLLSKNFLPTLQDQPQDHYNFEKALSLYAKKSKVMLLETDNEVISLKYPWDILALNQYLLKQIKRSVSKDASIAKSAEIVGDVVIEAGVKILEGARILGPGYIGKDAFVGNNAIVRTFSSVEENSVVGAQMEIKNTVLSRNSTTHSGFIGDSVIGEDCKIAAGFTSGNVRLDRKEIPVDRENNKVASERKSLGVIMGNMVNVGINVSTMPGITIGSNTLIGPSTTIMKNVPENTKYYTKFQEIVEKNHE